MNLDLKPNSKAWLPLITAVLAFSAVTASAHSSGSANEDRAQLLADNASLQREITRLDTDETGLKADTASGRMSAESQDSFAVYKDQRYVSGEKKDIASDKPGTLQMKSDKAALRRETRQLKLAEATLNADTREGKMVAESPDAEKVYRDRQAIIGRLKDIDADKANLKADEVK